MSGPEKSKLDDAADGACEEEGGGVGEREINTSTGGHLSSQTFGPGLLCQTGSQSPCAGERPHPYCGGGVKRRPSLSTDTKREDVNVDMMPASVHLSNPPPFCSRLKYLISLDKIHGAQRMNPTDFGHIP